MALSFPVAPADGDSYTVGGQTWYYRASKGAWQKEVYYVGVGPKLVDPDTGLDLVPTASYNDGSRDWDYYEFTGDDEFLVAAVGTDATYGAALDFVVQAGGGGGTNGFRCLPGAGAGGRLTGLFPVYAGMVVPVVVGAGGNNSHGSMSKLGSVAAIGGAMSPNNETPYHRDGQDGGCGSGAVYSGGRGVGGKGLQGFDGGRGHASLTAGAGAGGGGTDAAGSDVGAGQYDAGSGGAGAEDTLSGVSRRLGGGGGGAHDGSGTTDGSGGPGGGGIGGNNNAASNGAANTGGGAGGNRGTTARLGGSGLVGIRAPRS